MERLTGTRLRDFEKKEIFDPLGMKDSSLGLGGRRLSDFGDLRSGHRARTPPTKSASAPIVSTGATRGTSWGGMHGTTTDLAILLQTFLDGGVRSGSAGIQRCYGESDDHRPKYETEGSLGARLGTRPLALVECLRGFCFRSGVWPRRCHRHDDLGRSRNPGSLRDSDQPALCHGRRPIVAAWFECGHRLGATGSTRIAASPHEVRSLSPTASCFRIE